MGFRNLIDDRHSIRAFEARPVEREKVERILHAASRAPSAANLQSYRIAVLTSREWIEKLAMTKPQQPWVATAPVLFVFLGDQEPSTGRMSSEGQSLYTVQDPTIACAYTQLAAVDDGLGACWLGTSMLAVGYAAGPPQTITTRRPREEMVIDFDDQG